MSQPGSQKRRIASWLARIHSTRQQLGVSRFKNIALADFQIGGDSGSLIAVSGQATPPGTVSLPNSPCFETFEVPPGHSRAYDSEYKILEELASRFVQIPEVTGTVNLFTERPPCASCHFVIEQFRRRFSQINLIVTSPDSPERNS